RAEIAIGLLHLAFLRRMLPARHRHARRLAYHLGDHPAPPILPMMRLERREQSHDTADVIGPVIGDDGELGSGKMTRPMLLLVVILVEPVLHHHPGALEQRPVLISSAGAMPLGL